MGHLRVVEFGGLGPGPFAAMVLADLGADVVRIERPAPHPSADTPAQPATSPLLRGRRVVKLDLKSEDGRSTALALVRCADVLIDPFRPDVMDLLGLGPDVCMRENDSLVYVRMTGWGQDGPFRDLGGHDINYLALTGALFMIGEEKRPAPPLNLVADYGGGGMLLLLGALAALAERAVSGKGQVVDAAMVDGVALLMAGHYGLSATGVWPDVRGSHVLNGAAPFYNVYATADGRHVAVGAMEPKFYLRLVGALGLGNDPLFQRQHDRDRWAQMREAFAAVFVTRTMEAWCDTFAGVDACFTPVLSPKEAVGHPHARARGAYAEVGDVVQSARPW